VLTRVRWSGRSRLDHLQPALDDADQAGNDASERIMDKLGMRLEREKVDPTCGGTLSKKSPKGYCLVGANSRRL
jgi:hypothetical protein